MPGVIVCSACDLVHENPPQPAAERTHCARCRGPLHRPQTGKLDTSIALALSALVVFIFSNVYPLVAIQFNGTTRSTTLVGAALGLYAQGYAGLAALVLMTTVAGPFLQICGLLYLLIPLRRGATAPGQNMIFRLLTQIRPWTFIEVFMLGALVALVRLAAYSKVIPGVSLWSCGLLMLMLAALASRTTPEQFWHWVETRRA